MSQNKKTLLLGFSMIAGSFLCAIITFYFLGQADRSNKEKLSAMESQVVQLQEQSKNASQITSPQLFSNGPISLEDLLKQSEGTYDNQEKQRKDGFLWLDHRSNSFIVTLGALHGLRPGASLSIYDGNQKIDIARVDVPLDVISFVTPAKNSEESFNSNYYRVVIEDSQSPK